MLGRDPRPHGLTNAETRTVGQGTHSHAETRTSGQGTHSHADAFRMG
ncbi:hypothetical protein ACBJ59_29645 [Nonomuraea sp. MTCD27]